MYNTKEGVSESELEGLRNSDRKSQESRVHASHHCCESEITDAVLKNVLEAARAGRVLGTQRSS